MFTRPVLEVVPMTADSRCYTGLMSSQRLAFVVPSAEMYNRYLTLTEVSVHQPGGSAYDGRYRCCTGLMSCQR